MDVMDAVGMEMIMELTNSKSKYIAYKIIEALEFHQDKRLTDYNRGRMMEVIQRELMIAATETEK